MSFPEIPDSSNLTLQDALNLILKSIAAEEMSLSRLISAEKNKLLHIVNLPQICVQDILDINSSVDNTIKDIIKLQMLLQFKIECVKKMLPCVQSDQPISAENIQVCCCKYGKACGKAQGLICDAFNEFNGCNSEIEFNAEICCLKNGFIKYSTGNDCNRIILNGNIYEMAVNDHDIFFKGEGKCIRKADGKETEGTVKYIMMVYYFAGITDFDVFIISKNPLFQHRSGIIAAQKNSEIKVS